MRFLTFALTCCLLIGALACSANSRIVTPDLEPEKNNSSGNNNLWGLYDIRIDPVTLEASVLPARTVEFMLNVNKFMNMNPTSLTLQITDASQLMTEGLVTLDVNLTHPLPTKPKLAGLDVHCALFTDSTSTLLYDNTLSYAVEGFNPVLLNPDGWTRWYNAQEFTGPGAFGWVPGNLGTITNPLATLNPYKLYADGLAPTADAAGWLDANQAARALFSAGTTNTREYQLKFPIFGGSPFLKFQYAVIASWDIPGSDDPGPSDFPLSANAAEASAIRIDTGESTMYYTVDKQGGDLILNVDIFDWQGGDAIQDEVAQIIIESIVLDTPYVDSAPIMTQTPGEGFATWTATIPADSVTSTVPVEVWVIVESAGPVDYSPGITVPFPEGKPLAAFNRTLATILDEAPPEPPIILSGIDILMGTTRCPDRSFDTAGLFNVTVESTLPVTYSWSLIAIMDIEPLVGYDGIPGDGAGNLTVDFTDPIFAPLKSMLIIHCEASDGVYDPVQATPLEVYLDCIFFDADLEDDGWKDNMFWMPLDEEGTTVWAPLNASDPSGKCAGTGAFWSDNGTVHASSKGMLVSKPIVVPDFLTSAQFVIQHSYYLDAFNVGGNLKIGEPGSLETVDQTPITITSGKGYDGLLTDDTNAMYPQEVFAQNTTTLPLYTSYLDIPGVFLGAPLQIGFAAASGTATSDQDGGWLLDDVKIIGTL